MQGGAGIGDVIMPLVDLAILWIIYAIVRGTKPRRDFRRWFSTLPPPDDQADPASWTPPLRWR